MQLRILFFYHVFFLEILISSIFFLHLTILKGRLIMLMRGKSVKVRTLVLIFHIKILELRLEIHSKEIVL